VINGAAYYGNGDGTFRRGPQINSGAPLLADINGDGRPDVIGRDARTVVRNVCAAASDGPRRRASRP
jgi:hypothetical protein